MRHASLLAAEAGTRVSGALLERAATELRHESGRLTAALLGAERPAEMAELPDADDVAQW